MPLDDILRELGHQMGLGPLTLNEHRLCRLVFDGRMTVDIESLPDDSRFFVHAVAGRVPSDNQAAVFAELLSANLFGQETGGACLALDRGRDEILLFREFLTDRTDYVAFAAALATFVNRLDHWQNRFLSGEWGGDSTHEMPPSASFIRG